MWILLVNVNWMNYYCFSLWRKIIYEKVIYLVKVYWYCLVILKINKNKNEKEYLKNIKYMLDYNL